MLRLAIQLTILTVTVFVPFGHVQAQADLEPVTITAEDGLELYGLYSGTADLSADEDGVPAVLLMHHGNASKEKWLAYIPQLLEANYAVLTVDVRGFGETGGRGDQAPTPENRLTDAQQWVTWLRDQDGIDPARVNIVGASIGGDIGLNVAAADPELASITVVSAGLEVEGITTVPAVEAIEIPIFLVTGLDDAMGLEAVQGLVQVANTDLQIRIYETSLCCTFLVDFQEGLDADIIAWLDEHNR